MADNIAGSSPCPRSQAAEKRKAPMARSSANSAPAPAAAVETIVQSEELVEVLALLTMRERRVLELRYGLKGDKPLTLEEVGQQFGVTRERIRQIEAKTLAKLKAYREAQRLQDFLD